MKKQRIRRWKKLLGLVVCAGFCLPTHGDTFLVKDGQTQAEIVMPETPPRMTKLAANELQTYIEKISGAKLPIVTQPTKGTAVQVYVGRSDHTDRLNVKDEGLPYDAFRMVSGPNWLVLLGHDSDSTETETYIGYEGGLQVDFDKWDELTGGMFGNPMGRNAKHSGLDLFTGDQRGSLNAVYEFLRMQGVRWYFPGELGEVVPRAASIPLPTLDKTVHPDFPLRNLYIYFNDFRRGSADYIMWQLRLGLNSGRELSGFGSGFGHGLRNVHIRDKRHPDWFAMADGQRATNTRSGTGEPCLSSEGFFEATVKYAQAIFRIYPEQRMIDLGPLDGYGNLCQCDLCKDKGTFERGWNGRMSDYVWGFVNRVAIELYKTNPDRIVHCIAYSGYQLPPSKIDKMSPNVAITICRWRSNFIDPENRKMFRQLTEAWLAKLPSKELTIWDYYLHGRPNGAWDGVPVYFPHIIADDLSYLKGKSKGDFIEVSEYWPAWNIPRHAMAANHLNVYVSARLYWDADQDVDALLTEYYDKFYGPAAKPMRTFVEYAEVNWKTAHKDSKVIDQLGVFLAEARQAAGDTVYGKRIALIDDFMAPLRDKRDKLAEGRKNVPVVVAGKGDLATLTVDGKLDDAFWADAEAYPLRDLVTGELAAQRGSVKMVWAGDSLYLGIVCEDSEMGSLNIGSDEDGNTNILNGDNIELLIETSVHSYYQIAISPTGAMVDMDRNEGLNTLWASQGKVAAYRGKDAWTLEIRLPAAGDEQETLDPDNGIAGSQPSADNPWYLNVCRQRLRGETREFSAFSPTGSPSFHVLLKFGKLVVE